MRYLTGILLLSLLGTVARSDAWTRVAYDNGGVETAQPHLLAGSPYRYPESDVPLSAAAADAPARTVTFGATVRFGYLGLKPGARYKLRLTFLSDGPRSLRLSAGGVPLVDRLELGKGPPVRRDIDVPERAYARGRLTVEFACLAGPNAVVSEIEVLSSDPAALKPIPPAGQMTEEERKSLEAELRKVLPRITPRPAGVIRLDGTWQFHPSPPEEFWTLDHAPPGSKDIAVPGEWALQGFQVKPETAAAYFRTFDIPAGWKDRRIKLRFDNVYSGCRVWVNGAEVGGHEGGFVPFELDITVAARPGRNTLALAVRNESLRDLLASATQYAAHPLGGIARKVELFAVPRIHLADIKIAVVLDEDSADATLRARLLVANEGDRPSSALSCRLTVRPWPGARTQLPSKEVLARSEAPLPRVPAGRDVEKTVALAVRRPAKWDSEHPHLHVLKIELLAGGRVIETVEERFGFRQVEVRGNQLLVNGRPVKLHGICRHEVHPLLGRALDDRLWRLDARIYRSMNCNFIRTSHYPPAEEFLDRCDELGLFVELEAPLCWVGHGANAAWRKLNPGDDRFFSAILQANLESVQGYPNHPCVILRSMANESTWTELFARVARFMCVADPTRPLTFHDQSWGGYNNRGSVSVPVANIHYPGPGGPARAAASRRPITFGEFCHLNTYNRREIATDPGVRDAYGRALKPMWDAMYRSKGCLGGSIWSGIDDVFLLPDGRAVGYGNWGPIDGWRRKKPEFWHIKKSYSPVRIEKRSVAVPARGKTVRVAIENRYNFTNLSELDIEWCPWDPRAAPQGPRGPMRRVNAVTPPRSRGELLIAVEPEDLAGRKLFLRFTSPLGYIVDEYALSVEAPSPEASRETARASAAAAGGRVHVEESKDAWKISAETSVWTVSRHTGQLTGEAGAAGRGGRAIVTGGPHLMILPLKTAPCSTDHAAYTPPLTDVCADWKAASVELRRQDGCVEVSVAGRYDEAGGRYTMRISADGTATLAYRFTSSRKVNPRQWGMVLDVARACDKLRWKRDAFWTVYPPGHIGRPQGTALAAPEARRTLPPVRRKPGKPWELDATELGSNDFRATRSRIHSASLLDGAGAGLQVDSDGTQAVRAWVDGSRIRILVAGFNTGGGDMFLGKHYARERRPLKAGTLVEDTVRLRLLP